MIRSSFFNLLSARDRGHIHWLLFHWLHNPLPLTLDKYELCIQINMIVDMCPDILIEFICLSLNKSQHWYRSLRGFRDPMISQRRSFWYCFRHGLPAQHDSTSIWSRLVTVLRLFGVRSCQHSDVTYHWWQIWPPIISLPSFRLLSSNPNFGPGKSQMASRSYTLSKTSGAFRLLATRGVNFHVPERVRRERERERIACVHLHAHIDVNVPNNSACTVDRVQPKRTRKIWNGLWLTRDLDVDDGIICALADQPDSSTKKVAEMVY